MPEIKAVFFDLDGTLLDRNASLVKFIKDQYERYIKELSLINKQHFINRFLELDCRGYVWKDRVYSQLLQEMKITSLTWEVLLEDYLNNFKHACVPFRNVRKVLETLRQMGIKLGLISNGKRQFQRDNLKALGIADYFNTILISEEVGLRKPDPLIFQMGLDHLSVSAEESIFVGDHPENDIKAARDAGMLGIWKRDEYWMEAAADFTINDLYEIVAIVQNLKGAAVNEGF
ncbi:HAD family hydrolase [Bacillus sp. JJ1609]|uniref:HAD family hydrolase n=1 Tax=Bacillus sp. JJ1609 TaxID=3122977 RepID=UPI002FFEE622